MYTYDNINKIENSAQQKNIFIKDSNNLFNKKITEDTKKQILENNISSEKKTINQRKKKEEQKTKKKTTIDSYESKKTRSNKKEGNSNIKSRVIKVRGDEGFLKQTENRKKSSVIKPNTRKYCIFFLLYASSKKKSHTMIINATFGYAVQFALTVNIELNP